MNSPEMPNIEAVISGSFKFKPEIDEAITEFREYNVIVRAPELGWLYVPSSGLIVAKNVERFQPLPSEQNMLAGEVEAAFLAELDKADFVYVINPEGYIGDMAIFEIGYSQGAQKPMYSSNPLRFDALGVHDPKMIDLLQTSIPIMTPAEAVRDMQQKIHINLPSVTQSSDVSNHRLSMPSTANRIAEGAIMRAGERILLVADGRWENQRLTIPGTQVRPNETKTAALGRLVSGKMGVEVSAISHFATSFMLEGSGYTKPVNPDTFVFDDHLVDVQSQNIHPKTGIKPIWVSDSELERLITTDEIEPNAKKLLDKYLKTEA